jgi:hypothetical protein
VQPRDHDHSAPHLAEEGSVSALDDAHRFVPCGFVGRVGLPEGSDPVASANGHVGSIGAPQ